MEKVVLNQKKYQDYDCISLSNGKFELLVTVSEGPRIISFGFVNDRNEFFDKAEPTTTPEGDVYKFRGGHRLWHSPEHPVRTYVPDNNPVKWEKIENGIHVVQEVEKWAQIEKEMYITLNDDGAEIKHVLRNKNAWDVELSLWGITMMAAGGTEVIPQPTKDTGLLPNREISLWPYSKMNDDRVTWGEKYILLKQDVNCKGPFKVGLPNEDGWAAYLNGGHMFINQFKHYNGAQYDDFGTSYETYTSNMMTEMETLSPKVRLKPDETVEHTEKWSLYKYNNFNGEEKEVDTVVKSHIK